jgi:hypothetical protein
MIEKNDNGKFFPPKKDPSCLFLPTADDSGRVHPGEFLFIKDPGDNIPSALREIRYSGSTKDSAGFSVTYNYLTQKPESTDSSRFFLEKNYCKLLTKKDLLERIERIVTRVRERTIGELFPNVLISKESFPALRLLRGLRGEVFRFPCSTKLSIFLFTSTRILS